MTHKHTPIPWKVDDSGTDNPASPLGAACIARGKSSLLVAVVPAWLDDNTDEEARELAQADAAFIVEACNAYETIKKQRADDRDKWLALVEAREKRLKERAKENDTLQAERDALLEVARAVVKKETCQCKPHDKSACLLRKAEEAIALCGREGE